MPNWHDAQPEPLPDLHTIFLRAGETKLDEGDAGKTLSSDSLPAWLPNQRWYADKQDKIERVEIQDLGQFAQTEPVHLVTATVTTSERTARYFVPMATSAAPPIQGYWLAKLRKTANVKPLYDALADDSLTRCALEAMRTEAKIGPVQFRKTSAMDQIDVMADTQINRLVGEQSNSSVRIGNLAILKGIRQIHQGPHPEIEVTRFLTEAGFENCPALLGWAEEEAEGGTTALITVSAFVENQGDAWTRFTDNLVRDLEAGAMNEAQAPTAEPTGELEPDYAPPPVHDPFRRLGGCIGQMHGVLATGTDDDFAPEAITADDIAHWQQTARGFAEGAFAVGHEGLNARRAEVSAMIDALSGYTPSGRKTRIHGDLHLGQVLVAQDDFVVLDFEGEPARDLADRRAKTSPLRDVAGMIRSFDYAAAYAGLRLSEAGVIEEGDARDEALRWRDKAASGFLKGYWNAAPAAGDRDFDRALLRFFTLEKALYEVAYEANNRPDWVEIPAQGVLAILDGEG